MLEKIWRPKKINISVSFRTTLHLMTNISGMQQDIVNPKWQWQCNFLITHIPSYLHTQFCLLWSRNAERLPKILYFWLIFLNLWEIALKFVMWYVQVCP